MKTGIILLALGKPEYGVMAYSMAKSIKAQVDLPIIVYASDFSLNHLTDEQKEIFDEVRKAELKHYFENGMNPYKMKTFLYDLSPFDSTLYLDVDGIATGKKKIHELITILQKHDFVMMEVDRFTKENAPNSKTVWTKINRVQYLQDLWDLYKMKGEYPEYNSSFIWFKKTKENAKYFKQVQKVYTEKKHKFTPIGNRYPDELAFGIASSQLEYYSSIVGFQPIYFEWYSDLKDMKEIQHYFIGLAGGYNSARLVNYYNAIAKNFGTTWKFENKIKYYHTK